MALDAFVNFAKVTVSAGYDAAATSIVLSAGDGAKLPVAPFNMVWWNSTDFGDPSDDVNREVVRVTNVTVDTILITRAQEGTPASLKNTVGRVYRMVAGLTAKTLAVDLPSLTDFSSGGLVISRGAITTLTPTLNISETWNNGAIAFKTIFANVTNTASSANSALMLLQIGAADRFRVAYTGQVVISRVEGDTIGSTVTLAKQGTTGNAAAAITLGSEISRLETTGYDGTVQVPSLRITNVALEAFSGAARGSRVDFSLVPVTTTPLQTVMQLDTTALSLVNGTRLVINRGTLVAQAASIDSQSIWNNAGVTFTSWLLNVTDTASNAASLLMDLQVASVSKFRVDKLGNATSASGGALGNVVYGFSGQTNFGFYAPTTSRMALPFAGSPTYEWSSAGSFSIINNLGQILIGSATATNVIWARDSANVMALKNGTNVQSLVIYNTWTSTTNFERIDVQWAANVCQIWTEKGSGGGTARPLVLGADATEIMRFDVGTKISVFGVTPVVRQTGPTLNLTNNITAGGVDGTFANFTDLTTYATDAPTIRNNQYQLAKGLKLVSDALRAYGWIT